MTDAIRCDYCGLPTSGWPAGDGPAGHGDTGDPRAADAPVYCCLGCRLAASVAAEVGNHGDRAESQARWTLLRLGVAVFFSMNVMVFTLALWTGDIYEIASGELAARSVIHDLHRYVCLLFTGIVMFLLGGPIIENTIEQLERRAITTDLILMLGVASAFGYSTVNTFRGEGHVYFEVACMVLVAVTLGRWMEAAGRHKTTEAIRSLERLLPATVRVTRLGKETELPLDEVAAGDTVRVLPGERIAVDGTIEHGRAYIDQQTVTGESKPVAGQAGSPVFSGTHNLDGELVIRAESPGGKGTLADMIAAITSAAGSKDRYQRLADRVATWFLPALSVIAIATFGVHAARSGVPRGLMTSLAVVLIACPCALALATPMAIWASIGAASRRQVLFRSGDALSQLASARAICFDKTGTLTSGQPAVDEICVPDENRSNVIEIARVVAKTTTHALSRAVCNVADSQGNDNGPSVRRVTSARQVPGRGIAAELPSIGCVFLGSRRFMDESAQQFPAELDVQSRSAARTGASIVCIGWGGQVRGVFVCRERLRDETEATIAAFRELGLTVEILTGDHEAAALRLGNQLGVTARSGLLPEDKLSVIESLVKTSGPVVMVGDGVNDAPALAAADVGVAMGCGTDIARESADVCLLGNDLSRLVWATGLARRTVHVVRWNLLWSFAYNLIGIVLASVGMLNPMLAAVAMIVSSFLVVSNSLRLTTSAGLADASSVDDDSSAGGSLAGDDSPADNDSCRESPVSAPVGAA